jgi:hypothetical protein
MKKFVIGLIVGIAVAGGAATAASLITSNQIADDTIRARDMHTARSTLGS